MKQKIWIVPTIIALCAIVAVSISGARRTMADSWRTASRASVGIAPDPAQTPEAVVQVYVARAWGWRGTLGVHSWIAVKPTNASDFRVYEVIGWRARRGMSALAISNRAADARWFGSVPKVIADLRGDGVDETIRRIDVAARAYPHAHEYRVWPGPNSNTFTAHVARSVPELKVDFPPTAIGKDYIPNGALVARSPSGTGVQVSLFGLLGVLVGIEEGLEVNVLGLTFGVDAKNPAIKLPAVGRVGFD